MKKICILFCALLSSAAAFGQNTAGKIAYTETFKMNIDLGGDVDVKVNGADAGAPAMDISSLLPKEQKMSKALYFNSEAALYCDDKDKKNDHKSQVNHDDGDRQVMIKMDIPEDIIYTGIKEGKRVEQRDFMGRKFLVTADINKSAWKMTGKQKTILGMPCQQAMMKKDKDTVEAWFTPAIPVSAGPMGLSGLPGMILEASQRNISFVATAFTPGTADQALIVKPKEGKKVTGEEYDKIVEKKTKEMADEYGGNGNVIIKVNR